MRRLNPSTGEIFKRGDTREDGYRFWSYNLKRLKEDGFFVEQWHNPNCFENQKQLNRESASRWIGNNKEKFRIRYRAWDRANQHKKNARCAKRRAEKLKRTPLWLTKNQLEEIAKIYKLAKEKTKLTGIEHHVDHIIPLQGKKVSGLHVSWNLRIVTATENMIKGNRYVV